MSGGVIRRRTGRASPLRRGIRISGHILLGLHWKLAIELLATLGSRVRLLFLQKESNGNEGWNSASIIFYGHLVYQVHVTIRVQVKFGRVQLTALNWSGKTARCSQGGTGFMRITIRRHGDI